MVRANALGILLSQVRQMSYDQFAGEANRYVVHSPISSQSQHGSFETCRTAFHEFSFSCQR
jgi:hypothetical protein